MILLKPPLARSGVPGPAHGSDSQNPDRLSYYNSYRQCHESIAELTRLLYPMCSYTMSGGDQYSQNLNDLEMIWQYGMDKY